MTSAWTPQKVASFKAAFFKFLKNVRINSKNMGGDYCIADGVYDAQHRFLNGIFDGLGEDIHDFKVLKSRQLGISTIAEALFVFFLGMVKGCQAAVIFDTAAHTKEARTRILNIIKNLPPSLRYPKITSDSRDLLTLENGTVVRWLSAGVKASTAGGNLGRGSGCNVIWASEVSSWDNDEGLTSLLETLSESFPDRLYLWESTARGFNNWFDMWTEAKNDELGQRAIFIGWWAHPDHVILPGDRRYQKYGIEPPTENEAKKIAQVQRDYNHAITQDQLAWLRYKRDPFRASEDGEKKKDQFKQQEQPTVEEECFTQSGSSFFDHEALTQHTLRISTFEAPKRYKYSFGPEFPQTIITPAYHWRDLMLKVWEPPQIGVRYVIAADPAFGRNPENDRSACQVVACYADCIEQVAEFASPTVKTDQFAWVIASLAAWYQNVNVIIELDGPGENVWKEYFSLPGKLRTSYMKPVAGERGLLDVFTNVRNYIFSRPDSMSQVGNNWQWKTGNRKESIMEKLRNMVDNGTMILKSTDTVAEMRSIARDGASIEAPSHKKDDRVLALAFAAVCWEEQVRGSLMMKNYTKEAHIKAQKMTTGARYSIFMQNQITSLFHRNERVALAAARALRNTQLRRR